MDVFPARLRSSATGLAAAAVGLWTLLGVVEGCQYYFIRSLGSTPVTWEHALRVSVPRMWVWALLTPPIVVVAKRIGRRRRTVDRFGLHVLSALAFSLLGLTVGALVYYATANDAGTPLARLIPAYFAAHSAVAIIAYLAVTGAYYAYSYHERFHRRDLEASRLELRASRLEARLTESRLHLLREQLQPHFLFNTLHAIATLVLKGEAERGIRMIARLSEFLRLSLDQPPGQLVPLSEELELLDRYLAIQKARFGDRLRVERGVDPAAGPALVPSFLLQPLAENAIRHGVEKSPDAGSIRIRAFLDGEEVRVLVEDDGPGFDGDRFREGIGLRNTRLRLSELYGRRATLCCRNRPGGGASVEIALPLRTSAGSERGDPRPAAPRVGDPEMPRP